MMLDRRILFLGQKPIGEACFDVLLQNQNERFSVCGAVSNVNTNCWWKSANVYKTAIERGIPFIDNRKRHYEEITELIAAERINTIISVQHAWILPDSILQRVDGQAFNLHMAKLPDYQGYNAFSFAIINGDSEYCTTIHWMVPQVDAGNIIFEGRVPITSEDTAGTLYEKTVGVSLACFKNFVAMLKANETIPSRPLHGTPRFYGRDDLQRIKEIKDFSDPIFVDRVIRGCTFPNSQGAYFIVNNHKYFVFREEKD